MNSFQLSTMAIAVLLTVGLYFIPIKPDKNDLIDKSRALQMETMDESSLLQKAQEKYSVAELTDIQAFQDMYASATEPSEKIGWLEKISGAWYGLGESALSGVYAEKIAKLNNTEEGWSIAGTTYATGITRYDEPEMRSFCLGRAVKALENAISINPKEVRHRINLALCYVNLPPEGQPMKGVLMLRDLLDEYPEDVGVLTQLGQLAIKTGQYDKAIERLGKANSIAPDNKVVISYLINAYKGKGDMQNASEYEKKLNNIIN